MAASNCTTITQAEKLEQLEDYMLNSPQVECPVVHRFGPGIYIREVTIPAGTLAIGHAQKQEQLNIMLQGCVAMVDEDNKLRILKAPLIYVGPPGRKFGYAIETTVWQNIYATEETDVEKLEELLLDKSQTWKDFHEESFRLQQAIRENDREDYLAVLELTGFTPEEVRAVVENEKDLVPLPEKYRSRIIIQDSAIEGKGVFLSSPAQPGEVIAPGRLSGMRTPVGRYTNHAKFPNAQYVMDEQGDIYLVAVEHIHSCDEVTIDYRQALRLIGLELKED